MVVVGEYCCLFFAVGSICFLCHLREEPESSTRSEVSHLLKTWGHYPVLPCQDQRGPREDHLGERLRQHEFGPWNLFGSSKFRTKKIQLADVLLRTTTLGITLTRVPMIRIMT